MLSDISGVEAAVRTGSSVFSVQWPGWCTVREQPVGFLEPGSTGETGRVVTRDTQYQPHITTQINTIILQVSPITSIYHPMLEGSQPSVG